MKLTVVKSVLNINLDLFYVAIHEKMGVGVSGT
jgi:hypothetical protein